MRYGLVMVLALILAGGVIAQDERVRDIQTLTAGDVVTGQISDSQFEVIYGLEGEASQILLLEVTSLAEGNAFQWPEVILYTNDREILADSNDFVSITTSVIVVRLPYTGAYEVVVGRDDGRNGEGEGPYRLRVIEPQALVPGDTLAGTVTNDKLLNYYSIQQPGFFNVYYEFSGGELDPYIDLYWVDGDGELREAASADGELLRNLTLGMDGSNAAFHILTVGDNPYAFYSSDRLITASYRLRLIVNE